MAFRINHLHIKATDPRKTAEWYGTAFQFKIISDETRIYGDRFVRCTSADGTTFVSFSNARAGETLAPAYGKARYGLEHFAVECDDIDAEIARLKGLGANFQEGPIDVPGGLRVAFIEAPDGVRVELMQLPKAK